MPAKKRTALLNQRKRIPLDPGHFFLKVISSMMRLYFIVILLSILPLAPSGAYAQNASTIDELAEMYSIKKCSVCHEEKHKEWKDSSMGNSVIDPRVLRGWRTFIKLELDADGTMSRKDLRICMECHVPQIKDATDELVVHIANLVMTSVEDADEAKKNAAVKELSKLNLNCLGCHNLRALGLNGDPKPDTIYVPDEIDDSAHKEAGFQTVTSSLLKTSGFCAQCHHCPPNVPWEKCPTLYTTYVEGFLSKGRTETCQGCHMEGEKKSHRFPGPDDPDLMKDAVTLNINARPTRYIDNYNGMFLPAIAVEIDVTNNAGHVLPHGCAVLPKTVLDISVKDQDGKELFTRQKEYSVNDLYFKGGKKVAMAEWDITATEHMDLGLKPLETDKNIFIIPLETGTRFVEVEAVLKYLYTRDSSFTMKNVIRKVDIEDAP
ncbi:MAG: hypothetical protein HY807_00880 [Nitrospirae bacterium]|nr:hypothetical protein [Nitrospirota bacterium]